MSAPNYTRVNPPREYNGPTPVYLVAWPGITSRCYVRRNARREWETAVVPEAGVRAAEFSICPVLDAADSRSSAVYAWLYYHGGTQS